MPLLQAGIIIKDVKEDNGVRKYVVGHQNGALVNEIISKKLNEENLDCLFSQCQVKIDVKSFDLHLKQFHKSSFWVTFKGYVCT